jgi:hypothetical protein
MQTADDEDDSLIERVESARACLSLEIVQVVRDVLGEMLMTLLLGLLRLRRRLTQKGVNETNDLVQRQISISLAVCGEVREFGSVASEHRRSRK